LFALKQLRRDELYLRVGVTVAAAIILSAMVVRYTNKVLDDGSAIVRWRPLLQRLVQSEDVYRDGAYPNPPLLGICLYPLALLPPIAGALVWFFLKLLMAATAVHWSIQLATEGRRELPIWATAAIWLLSLRPIMGDLQHGNVNLLVFFLVAAGLWAFAARHDWLAGLAIALATTFKVTPALFVPYFAYKRQWHVVGASLVGLVLFLFVAPGVVLGPARNVELLKSWCDVMVAPYVVRGQVETLQVNQSLPGLVYRLCTDSPGIRFKDGSIHRVNFISLDSEVARWGLKAAVLAILAWLAFVCRTPTDDRRDWRLSGEFALVCIAMLFISERSWKHHYVTMALPFAVVVSHWVLRSRGWAAHGLVAALASSLLLMASTSTELGGWMGREGHKYAQAYGMFFLSAQVVFVAISVVLLRAGHGSAAPASHRVGPTAVAGESPPTTGS
jgi:hypothetical protein